MRLTCCFIVAVALGGCLNSFDRVEHVVEGFGAQVQGAAGSPSGASSCVVTVSEGTGPGTIYDCVSAGGREVRFDVSEVMLGPPDLIVRNSHTTLAGETAPAPGLTITQPRGVATEIRASQVVLRYFRVRGPGPRTDAGGDSHKLFRIDGSSALVEDVAIHHVTAIAADGAFDPLGSVQNVTVERSIIRDMGSALTIQGVRTVRDQISIHHNLFAGNEERQPLVRGESRTIDIRNNIIFGWNDPAEGGNGVQIDPTPGEAPSLNLISNVFVRADGLFGDAAVVTTNPDQTMIFAMDNMVPDAESGVPSTLPAEIAVPEFARVTTTPAADVPSEVLGDVGSGHPDDAALIEVVADALR